MPARIVTLLPPGREETRRAWRRMGEPPRERDWLAAARDIALALFDTTCSCMRRSASSTLWPEDHVRVGLLLKLRGPVLTPPGAQTWLARDRGGVDSDECALKECRVTLPLYVVPAAGPLPRSSEPAAGEYNPRCARRILTARNGSRSLPPPALLLAIGFPWAGDSCPLPDPDVTNRIMPGEDGLAMPADGSLEPPRCFIFASSSLRRLRSRSSAWRKV
mmetsp:Transcript_15066/g.26181  ORF Transcript_15066/g.26181 Transcript_15066/m.26181 type:complete len:219 (-) Transcript_15066:41-697(-)